MMHPKYERMRAIGEAMDAFAQRIDTPIDSIQVDGGHITVGAGDRRLRMRYGYNNAYSEDGGVMPGSGRWFAEIEDEEAQDAAPRRGWRALFGRSTRK